MFPLKYLPEIPIDLVSSKSDFSGMGFSQVAEGYLNMGIFGSVLVFVIQGYIWGKMEFRYMNSRKLCFVGSVLVILINCSRNTFIFVPGQITVMLILYYVAKMVSKIRVKIRIRG